MVRPGAPATTGLSRTMKYRVNYQAIRTRREQLGLSVRAAASRAGMKSHSHWHRIELGRCPEVAATTLASMAFVLRVAVTRLIEQDHGSISREGAVSCPTVGD